MEFKDRFLQGAEDIRKSNDLRLDQEERALLQDGMALFSDVLAKKEKEEEALTSMLALMKVITIHDIYKDHLYEEK